MGSCVCACVVCGVFLGGGAGKAGGGGGVWWGKVVEDGGAGRDGVRWEPLFDRYGTANL